MAGISSKAFNGVLANKKKFNEGTEFETEEFSDGSGLELYATNYRSMDPQIGRFWQIDPIAEMSEGWSPFTYANNSPIYYNDPLGLTSDSTIKPAPPVPSPTPCLDCPTGGMAEQKSLPDVILTAKKSGSNTSYSWAVALDVFQAGLDLVGMVPVFGEIADGTNAAIYTARGDYINAGLSAAAMIPLVGNAVTGSKLAVKTVQITSKARKATDALKLAERVLGKGYKEIAPGVYRSADGLKQFRMTGSDLAGKQFDGIPHVHIEVFDPENLNDPIKNYHIPLKD